MLLLSVYPGTKRISEMMAMHVPDGSDESLMHYLVLCTEMLIGAGIVDKTEEATALLGELGFFLDEYKDGMKNSITIQDKIISFSYSSRVGIGLFVSPK